MSDIDQKALLTSLQDMAEKAGLDITEELEKINTKLKRTSSL